MNSGSFFEECTPSSSTPVRSEYLQHAQNVAIGDNANFSTVHGDQNVYYNLQERKMTRYIVGTKEEEMEYEQFREVLRSDVIASRNVYSGPARQFYDERWELVELGERTVVAGEVRIGGVASKCLVVSYSGEGAEEAWKEDFWRLCGTRRPENAQLVAINLSRIPMLVLTGDLVPAAHLADRVGEIGKWYLISLAFQMGYWWDSSLWMDTSRGVFCRGPKGPRMYGGKMELDNLPLDTELVKEDVLARYLASRLGDRGVVKWVSQDWDYDLSQVKVVRPTVISTLDNTILAVGSGFWEEGRCFGERTELSNGTTRFTLQHNRRFLVLMLDEDEAQHSWLAQAPSVFHAHGISLEGDLSKYKLILPEWLISTLSQSKAKRQRRRKCLPIYLFLSGSTFWSFDQDGQTPIPTDLCRHLGLSLSRKRRYEYTWETSTYKALRDYQIGRKFDPTTTDFAQYNNHRIYDVVKDRQVPSRFEEMDDSDLPESTSAPRPEACTESTHHIEMELEDLSLELLFGDTTVKACQDSTLVVTPAPHKASSSDDTRRNGGRIVRKESATKSLAPSSTSQPARRAVPGLKPTSKSIVPSPIRPLRTPAKPTSVTKPPEVAMRRVAPSSQKPLLNGAKDATVVLSARHETAGPPRDTPVRTSTSKPERRKETGTHSVAIPRNPTAVPIRKPTSPPVFRTTIKTPAPASTSTSTAKKSASPSVAAPRPGNPIRSTAKSATPDATSSRPPPSAPPQRVSTTPLRNVASKAKPQSTSLPSPGARTVTESRRITSAAVPSATTNASSPAPQDSRRKTSVVTSERTPSRPPLRGAKPHVPTSSSRSRPDTTRSRS